ncbi:ABC transporter permease [Longispora fulva]|uniref:Multiple sugar transport system permease protein n=1 Tax=Longispora fulva TaxID=619741 RepID=A0A8J7GG29_9ACTN|nr:carbohydrate ABC transporter permease [Longispora fulva]MBG6138294.1 multiple sugar transport system permease protein [Longispora fulva]GIG60545.1 ABC transporter permease [Longispora fulva]
MTVAVAEAPLPAGAREPGERPARRRVKPARVVLHAFLVLVSLGWLAPVLLSVYASLRPYQETAEYGYLSWPRHLTLHYYTQAWQDAEMPKYYLNSLVIAIPAVLVTLFLASFLAFAITRQKIPGGKILLVMFTAGNLLPPQVLLIPLYTLFNRIPLPYAMSDSELLYDSYWGVILIHVAFQTGFCVFVLSNYMRTIPHELTEAAVMDGAGVWRQYRQIVLPLCRPALGALATLEFTWIYNDFLWALVLISTGDKMPVTTALQNLRGQFFTDYNLLAAGAVLVALPTVFVFSLLQKQFVAGLTLGANKG